MRAAARPPVALRPFLAADAPVLAAIFRAGIEALTQEDYTVAQQEAWASAADDIEAFAARLSADLTLIATREGLPVGFIAMKGKDEIDMLYVHPQAAGEGVATALCDALEKLAAARGVARLSADASDTALGFFERRGYQPRQRNTRTLAGEWLANTTVTKNLEQKERA